MGRAGGGYGLVEAAQARAPVQLLLVDLSIAQTHGTLVQDLCSAPQYGHPRLVLMTRHGAALEPGALKADAYGQAFAGGALAGLCGRAVGLWLAGGARRGRGCSRVAAQAGRILVVEDNRTSQTIAQACCMLGYKTEVVANGRMAVLAFKREPWDLILMDCNMPEMDGYEATTAIRALEGTAGKRVPIVAMTANTQAADVAKCLSAGMDDHLSKPLTLEQLRARLQRWLPLVAVPAPAVAPPESPVPVRKTDDVVDVGVLIRLREALGGTIGPSHSAVLGRHAALPGRPGRRRRRGDARFALHRTCHQGCCGQFGCPGLSELARELEVLSETGQGDHAAQLLPRLRAEYSLVMQDLQHEPEAEAEITSPQAAMDAARVLIVDDDRSTRSTLGAASLQQRFCGEPCRDGSEVTDAVQRARPDVILMDALMPVMDGFTACALLKATPDGQGIPVLMITALEDNASIERAFAAGASDYIPKPLHLAVNQRVRRTVDATRAERHVRHRPTTTR
ncbi:MAG: response regulator [Burkholderiales bacterium]|nr:response regulator [Burkholderiales bacterium]